MKHSSDQRGALPIMALILAVVAVAVVGIAVYNSGKVRQKVAATASPSPLVSTSASPQAKVSPTPTPSNVLGLDDWGIKIRLESSLADTRVIYNKQGGGAQSREYYYTFTTSRIQALGGNCASTTLQFGAIVSLFRLKTKPVATPDGELINDSPIGGYYYILTSPSASCSGMGVRSQSTTEAQDRAALRSSLKTLSPISN